MAAQPLIQLSNISYVSFEGLSVAYSRSDAIALMNCSFVQFVNVSVSNAGIAGIVIADGKNNTLRGVHVAHTGGCGVQIDADDAVGLKPSGHLVEHCTIHDFSRRCLTYNPGIHAYGVGIRVASSEIYNGPHSGILTSGNDNIFEDNVIHHTIQQVYLFAPSPL